MKWQISSISDWDVVIPRLTEMLPDRRKWALYGELGAGKTTFVQAFCRWLGTAERPDSPTFSLVNEYTYRNIHGQPAYVHHIDLYRIERLEEAIDLGIEEMLYDPWHCFIEWPQIVEPILPADTVRLQLQAGASPMERYLFIS